MLNAEWDKKFPGREPIIVEGQGDDGEVYSDNITHNLTKMASEVGIYKYLWRPEELDITTALQLVIPLSAGLGLLEGNPEKWKKFNPSNGWGTYKGLVRFVRDYWQACKRYPDAVIHVYR